MMRRLFCLALVLGCVGFAMGVQAQTLPPFDQLFLRSEARSSAYELAIGRLAQNRASRPAVKAYADTLVQDHAADEAALRALAAKKNLVLEMGLSRQSEAALGRLSRYRNGRAFDAAFVAEARRVNGAAMRAFRAEASRTTDPDIQQFVKDQLSMDDRHATMLAPLAQLTAPHSRMPIIRPPMSGTMPVVPPPSGGTTPVIPPNP